MRFAPEEQLYTPEELKRIDLMRANGVLLDPDGFDTPEEVRAALDRNYSEKPPLNYGSNVEPFR